MMDYSVWIEVKEATEVEGGWFVTGTPRIAGREAIDKMATEQERYFRTAQLDERKREFAARSIYEFYMDSKE